MKLICKVIGTVAALWPSAKQACGKVKRTLVIACITKTRTAPAHPHQWVHYDGKWTCKACFTFAHSDTSQAKRISEHCPGYSAKLAGVLGNPQGHSFAAADKDGPSLIICFKCGGWAERNPVHLRLPCPGAPHKGGLQAFGRIARGAPPELLREPTSGSCSGTVRYQRRDHPADTKPPTSCPQLCPCTPRQCQHQQPDRGATRAVPQQEGPERARTPQARDGPR